MISVNLQNSRAVYLLVKKSHRRQCYLPVSIANLSDDFDYSFVRRGAMATNYEEINRFLPRDALIAAIMEINPSGPAIYIAPSPKKIPKEKKQEVRR